MSKKTIFLSILSIAVIVACKKETDSEIPVINITSPTADQMIMSDSVLVAFTVTDADTHGYDYAIINTTTNDTLYDDDQHTHANVTFSEKFSVPVPTQLKLVVNAEDHSGNTSSKTVNFHTM